MGDLTVQRVVLRIAALVLVAAVHGGTVAGMAVALGDPGPRQDGRLTLNPLRHLDVLGGLLTVLLGYGWIRPIAVDPARLRPGRAGPLVIVVAACGATMGLAVLLRLLLPGLLTLLPDTAATELSVFVATARPLCVAFALFNLLPLPPLTGGLLLHAVLPGLGAALRRAQPFVAALLALLMATALATRLPG